MDKSPVRGESAALLKAREKRMKALACLQDALLSLEIAHGNTAEDPATTTPKQSPLKLQISSPGSGSALAHKHTPVNTRKPGNGTGNSSPRESTETEVHGWGHHSQQDMELSTQQQQEFMQQLTGDEALGFQDMDIQLGTITMPKLVTRSHSMSDMSLGQLAYSARRQSYPENEPYAFAAFPAENRAQQYTDEASLPYNHFDPSTIVERHRVLKMCLQYRQELSEHKHLLKDKEKFIQKLYKEAENSKAKSKKLLAKMMKKIKEEVDNQVALGKKLKESQDETAHLASGMKKMRGIIDQLRRELEEQSNEYNALQSTVENYVSAAPPEEIDALRKKLEKSEKQCAAAQRENQAAKALLEQMQAEAESAKIEMEGKWEEWNIASTQREAQVKHLEENLAKLKAQMKERAETEAHGVKLALMKRQLVNAQGQRDQALEALEQIREEVLKAVKEMDEERERWNTNVSDLQEELASAKSDLSEALEDSLEWQMKVKNLEDTILQLSQEKNSALSMIKEADTSSHTEIDSEQETEMAMLKEREIHLMSQIASLKEELDEHKSRVIEKTVQTPSIVMEEQAIHLDQQKVETEEAFKNFKAEIEALKDREKHLVDEIAKLKLSGRECDSSSALNNENASKQLEEQVAVLSSNQEGSHADEVGSNTLQIPAKISELEELLRETRERELLGQEELQQLRQDNFQKGLEIKALRRPAREDDFELEEVLSFGEEKDDLFGGIALSTGAPADEEKGDDLLGGGTALQNGESAQPASQPSDDKLEMFLKKLEQEGFPIIKHGQRGAPKERVLRCNKERNLIYYPKEASNHEKTMSLDEFAIIPGKNLTFFKTKATSDNLCFSLVGWKPDGGRNLLNIECKGQAQKTLLIEGLQSLLEQRKKNTR